MKKLNIKAIRIDGGTQSRVEINGEAVSEYAEALSAGASFPPVVTFFDGVDHWLADGFHRFHAFNKLGIVSIDADVRTGTQRDAVLYSWGANDKHGLPRSNADKRHIVTVILKDEQGRQWSDNKIAKDFGFSHPFVGNVRRSLETVSSEKSAERTYTTKHGTTAVMNTASIGKAQLPKLTPEQIERSAVRIETEMNREKRAQIAELQSELTDAPDAAEMAALAMAEQSDREAMEKLLDADDKLATAFAEIKRLNAELAQMRISRDGYMNKCNEAIALVKKRDRQISAMERAQREATA